MEVPQHCQQVEETRVALQVDGVATNFLLGLLQVAPWVEPLQTN